MNLTLKQTQLLSHTFLFAGLDPEQIRMLVGAENAEIREYLRHEQIYDRESFRKELGILLKGKIRVTKGDLIVSELKMGDLFGAAALFNEEDTYVSELTALTACRILFLSQTAIQSMMDRTPAIGINYVRYLSGRIRFLSDKVDALSGDSGAGKLNTWLVQNVGEDGSLILPCSMTELAGRLGISRATLYRDMEQLAAEGVIIRNGKKISLTTRKNERFAFAESEENKPF